ncbi:YciI family protein [Sphingobacterium suaedae]|uniref:YciI family protein n=1 Tax=Sphingobacterium suaedae TaxID=1686402 RepID=A0ABW5KFZ0_9SPHI
MKTSICHLRLLYCLLLMTGCFLVPAHAQDFPDFLAGDWKVEGKDNYEHWDRLNNNLLRGFSYSKPNDLPNVQEYMEIQRNKTEVVYNVQIPGAHQGEISTFVQRKEGHQWFYENPSNDFPKTIVYELLDPNKIQIHLRNETQDTTYTLRRLEPSETSGNGYDEELAKRLGADDRGMKNYFFVMLKTGQNKTGDKELIQQAFQGHMQNMDNMVKAGKLVVAGPFGKNDAQQRGLFIVQNLRNEDEVRQLLLTDPAIAAGLLQAEITAWYGSAALPLYLEYVDKLIRKK